MNTSHRRHRTGLLLVGAASLIALSATASISYADPETAPIETTEVPASVVADSADGEAKIHMIVKDDEGGHFEWHSDGEPLSEEEEARVEAELARAEAEMERAGVEIERAHAEHAKAMHDMEKAHEVHMLAMVDRPEVEEEVSANGKVRTIRVFKRGESGDRKMVQELIVDESKIQRDALQSAIRGIETARASIASNTSLSAKIRAEVMAELDAEIAELKADLAED